MVNTHLHVIGVGTGVPAVAVGNGTSSQVLFASRALISASIAFFHSWRCGEAMACLYVAGTGIGSNNTKPYWLWSETNSALSLLVLPTGLLVPNVLIWLRRVGPVEEPLVAAGAPVVVVVEDTTRCGPPKDLTNLDG